MKFIFNNQKKLFNNKEYIYTEKQNSFLVFSQYHFYSIFSFQNNSMVISICYFPIHHMQQSYENYLSLKKFF